MKKKILSFFLGIIICFIILEISLNFVGLLFKFNQEKYITNSDGYTILALGDSTTAIGGKNSWPNQLERILNNHSNTKNYSVINQGIVLINSTEILNNLNENLEKYNPNMVIIMAGINDIRKKNQMNKNVYKIKTTLTKLKTYRLLEQLWPETFGVNMIDYSNTEKAYESETTIYNFNKINEILKSKNISFVVMQYPLRNLSPLKKVFINQENIIFIDNELIFKNTLNNKTYDELFVDKFGKDFGHCTPLGNNMIAKNIFVNIFLNNELI